MLSLCYEKNLYVTLIDVTFDAGLHALETNHFPLLKRRKKAMWIRIYVKMYLNICSAICKHIYILTFTTRNIHKLPLSTLNHNGTTNFILND